MDMWMDCFSENPHTLTQVLLQGLCDKKLWAKEHIELNQFRKSSLEVPLSPMIGLLCLAIGYWYWLSTPPPALFPRPGLTLVQLPTYQRFLLCIWKTPLREVTNIGSYTRSNCLGYNAKWVFRMFWAKEMPLLTGRPEHSGGWSPTKMTHVLWAGVWSIKNVI